MTTTATIVEMATAKLASTRRILETVAVNCAEVNMPRTAAVLRAENVDIKRIENLLAELVTVEAADAMRPEMVMDPETGTLKEKKEA